MKDYIQLGRNIENNHLQHEIWLILHPRGRGSGKAKEEGGGGKKVGRGEREGPEPDHNRTL